MAMDWDYSRNQRRHTLNPDGETYGDDYFCLFEIRSCTAYRFVTKPSDGYELYHKGVMIRHGKTVKELKLLVETLVLPPS